VRRAILTFIVVGLAPYAAIGAPAAEDDMGIAQNLAEMLRDARTVISDQQDLINNPQIGDKHLTGKVVLDEAVAKYTQNTGADPEKVDPASRRGRLLRAMMAAIVEVVDENQPTINEQGTGFKGFIPAVFGRLVAESFLPLAKGEAEIKVTAPVDLVRNRKARPDPWETQVIEKQLLDPAWPKYQLFSAEVETKGRPAFRVLVPEYYGESCLACHGSPKGEMDVTGYPKEGGKLNDLGGVISITLYH
jgi:uncharacterized protein DUF3365